MKIRGDEHKTSDRKSVTGLRHMQAAALRMSRSKAHVVLQSSLRSSQRVSRKREIARSLKDTLMVKNGRVSS